MKFPLSILLSLVEASHNRELAPSGAPLTLVPLWMTSLNEVRQKFDDYGEKQIANPFGHGGVKYVQYVCSKLSSGGQNLFPNKTIPNRIVFEMTSFIKFRKSSEKFSFLKSTENLQFRIHRILGILDSLHDVAAMESDFKIDFDEAFAKNSRVVQIGFAAISAIPRWKTECTNSAGIIFESLRLIGRLSLTPYDIRDYADIIIHAQAYHRAMSHYIPSDCGIISEMLRVANEKTLRKDFINEVRNLTSNKFLEHIEFDAPHHL